MKHNNIIDLRNYRTHEETAIKAEEFPVLPKIIHVMGRAFDVAATAAITLCVCACTLLFFTML